MGDYLSERACRGLVIFATVGVAITILAGAALAISAVAGIVWVINELIQ